MPRPEKVQAVEEIRQRLAETRATFVTEYRGLTVGEQQTLRAALRAANGEYKVVKMSLARLAADAEGLGELTDVLAGPTALAFAASDPVPVAKALRDFAKEHERLIIKGGVLAGEILLPEKIARLADIEPRDVLLGKLAGAFEAPLVKLAGLVQALPRNAASMFSQLLEKKEASGDSPAEAAASEEPPAADTATEEAPVAEETAVVEDTTDEIPVAEDAPVEEPPVEDAPVEEQPEASDDEAAPGGEASPSAEAEAPDDEAAEPQDEAAASEEE